MRTRMWGLLLDARRRFFLPGGTKGADPRTVRLSISTPYIQPQSYAVLFGWRGVHSAAFRGPQFPRVPLRVFLLCVSFPPLVLDISTVLQRLVPH